MIKGTGRRVERNKIEVQNRKKEKRGIRKLGKGGRKTKCELNEGIKLEGMRDTSPQAPLL